MSNLKKIKIVTDSTCDLSIEELKELEVDIVPVSVIIEGEKFKQNVDITTEDLYHQLIVEKKSIGTAAPSPGEFYTVFEKALMEAETLIYISLTKKLSAVYSTAKLVAEKYFPKGKIFVVDTQTVSLAQAILVQEAAMMEKEGKSVEEIIERIEYLSDYAKALPLLDTLEYLHRGGRIKLYQRLLGNFLGFKALVLIDKKGSTLDAKARGKKNALIQLKMCGLQIQDHLKVNRMFVAYTTNRELAEEVAKFLRENGDKNIEIRVGQLGPVIGVHGGNDVVGFGFIGEYNSKMFTEVGKLAKDMAADQFVTKAKG